MPRRVFISHSSADMAAARSICAALEDARIQCWIAPRDIPYTHDFPTEIVSAIAQSWLMLLVLSEHANFSTHIPLEVTQAHEKGICILPVYIENVATLCWRRACRVRRRSVSRLPEIGTHGLKGGLGKPARKTTAPEVYQWTTRGGSKHGSARSATGSKPPPRGAGARPDPCGSWP
jgi:hypothetical protein